MYEDPVGPKVGNVRVAVPFPPAPVTVVDNTTFKEPAVIGWTLEVF